MDRMVIRRAWNIARDSGLRALAVQALQTLLYVGSFYLYEHDHRTVKPLHQCSLDWPCTEVFVADNATADIIARGQEDFRLYRRDAWKALELGAVAFCIYEGRALVHLGWLAISAPAREALDALPYGINFHAGIGWTGAAFTRPGYRNSGLLTHSCQRRFEYLRACGIDRSRAAVDVKNVASHRATMRFNPRIYAVGRYVRIFRFRWWSERPFDGT